MTDNRTIQIEDGTFENPERCTHRRGRNWVAIVERDKSQPGGLDRCFLARAPAGRVHMAGLDPGMWLEFAGDYYSCGGSKRPNRKYCRIVEVTSGFLVVQDCEIGDVGKMQEAEPVNPLAAYSDEQILAEAARRNLELVRGAAS